MELDRELPSSSASSSSSSSSFSSSLKQKLCSSICFSCCFNVHGSGGGGGGGDHDCEDRPIALARLLPELGERWRDVAARIGLQSRRLAGEFRYDPLSYSLNFDDGAADDDDSPLAGDAGFQFRNFSSRPPPSPSLAASPAPAPVIA